MDREAISGSKLLLPSETRDRTVQQFDNARLLGLANKVMLAHFVEQALTTICANEVRVMLVEHRSRPFVSRNPRGRFARWFPVGSVGSTLRQRRVPVLVETWAGRSGWTNPSQGWMR